MFGIETVTSVLTGVDVDYFASRGAAPPTSDIVLADDPGAFAGACINLLSHDEARRSIAHNALGRAQSEFSWDAVSREFEAILEDNRIHYNSVISQVER